MWHATRPNLGRARRVASPCVGSSAARARRRASSLVAACPAGFPFFLSFRMHFSEAHKLSKDTPLELPGSWSALLRAAWPPRRRPSAAATTTPRTHRTCMTAPRRVWFCVETPRRFVLKTEDPPNCPPDEWHISCVASYGYVPSFPAPERHAATSLRSSNLRAIATLRSELTNRSLHHTLVIRRHCRPHF